MYCHQPSNQTSTNHPSNKQHQKPVNQPNLPTDRLSNQPSQKKQNNRTDQPNSQPIHQPSKQTTTEQTSALTNEELPEHMDKQLS
jgi:hypothetical protein